MVDISKININGTAYNINASYASTAGSAPANGGTSASCSGNSSTATRPYCFGIPTTHDMSGNVYVKLGTWSGTSDSQVLIVKIYDGDGYNAGTSQNTRLTVFCKDGWQSTTSASNAYGVTVYADNGNGFSATAYATAYNSVDIYFTSTGAHYTAGWYCVEYNGGTWTHSGAKSNSTTGTLQNVEVRENISSANYKSYSTYNTLTATTFKTASGVELY